MNITRMVKPPAPCRVDTPVYDTKAHGWYVGNSTRISDCVPVYRNCGGGVVSEDLTDLTTAISQSIVYLNQRIDEAERLKKKLTGLLNAQNA